MLQTTVDAGSRPDSHHDRFGIMAVMVVGKQTVVAELSYLPGRTMEYIRGARNICGVFLRKGTNELFCNIPPYFFIRIQSCPLHRAEEIRRLRILRSKICSVVN
jgi:hypothetical protein